MRSRHLILAEVRMLSPGNRWSALPFRFCRTLDNSSETCTKLATMIGSCILEGGASGYVRLSFKGAANSGEALHRCRPDVVIKDNADKVDEGLQIIYSFDVGVDQWMTVRTQQKNK